MYLDVLIEIYNIVAEFFVLNQSVNQGVNNENKHNDYKKYFKSNTTNIEKVNKQCSKNMERAGNLKTLYEKYGKVKL